MRVPQLILSLFLLFTFVVALPVPAPVDALVERAQSASKKGSAAGRKKEAAGIDKNINIQKQEQKDVKKVQKAEGTKDFKKQSGQLNKDIAKGQKQREKNQKNADPKNKQLNEGLKKVWQMWPLVVFSSVLDLTVPF